MTVSTEDAYTCTRTIAKTEGLLLGISSGSALQAAIQIGQDPAYKDKNIVVLLPDTYQQVFLMCKCVILC